MEVIKKNKKAFHDYFVSEKIEAGLVLMGTEVKSIRLGKVNFKDSYVVFKHNEMYLISLDIQPYEQGGYTNHSPDRQRKLLLHKKQILKLSASIEQKGNTIIPLMIYLKNSLVKVELGVCKGKKSYDKRNVIAEKDAKRRIERILKG